ncbi:TPA_asm: P3 [Euphorbia alphacytorhabdovirus 1]|nr:TPA_asm: P3 [Euphorbia alphacytorhabdovirus 1]
MSSFALTIRGELSPDCDQKIVKLSKKFSILQFLWVSAGYDNIAISRMKFSYKSRCPKVAEGTVELTIKDLRLEDADMQEVANVSFDVKDWVEITWSYPIWFHYTDFSNKDNSVLNMCLDIIETNMSEKFSLGSYKIKIYYRVQNQITRFRQMANKALLIDQTVQSEPIRKTRGGDKKVKPELKGKDSIATDQKEMNSTKEEHKSHLMRESKSYISSRPRSNTK